MSATSIMSSKSLCILHWLYIRCLYHSESALVLIPHERCLYHSGSTLIPIPHERVRLPPQNAKNPALKPRITGKLKDERHLNYVFQVFGYIELVI